jgi:hypothetical protein
MKEKESMKILTQSLVLIISVGMQAADHPAHQLAKAFVALVGERYGKEESLLPPDYEESIHNLYSTTCRIIMDGDFVIRSRAGVKEQYEIIKAERGMWRFTDVSYRPDSADKKHCMMTFLWWTQKKGVFKIEVDLQTTKDGRYIDSCEETATQIYTNKEVS